MKIGQGKNCGGIKSKREDKRTNRKRNGEGGNKNITIQMGWREGTKGKTEERKIGKKI